MGKVFVTVLVLLSICFSIFAILSLSAKNTLPDISKTILYFGNTCPHCADLAKYIEESKIKEKIALEEKEVYENKNNATELSLVARSCNILDNTRVGVPFLYAEGKCFVGIEEIKTYFKIKTNLP
jgi:glutaredoxin-related protein